MSMRLKAPVGPQILWWSRWWHSHTSAWAHTVSRCALACHIQKPHWNTWKTQYFHLCRSKPTRRIVHDFNPLVYACFKQIPKTLEISIFSRSHPITSQHSPASSRQPEVCACMPHPKTSLKHIENLIVSCMPSQAYKKNRARLQSIGVCMLQKSP